MNTERPSGLYSSAMQKFPTPHISDTREGLSHGMQDFLFAMQCNGQFLTRPGKWRYGSFAIEDFVREFDGARVAFFGPNPDDKFYSGEGVGVERLGPALRQQPVIDVIGKFRKIDEDQAARIAFILGGIVRHFGAGEPRSEENMRRILKAVEFVARMTLLGEPRSGEAIASAMAMYVISGGMLDEDNHFVGQVYRMAEAVNEDPIDPFITQDLGLSQVARLRTFAHKSKIVERRTIPTIEPYEGVFEGFPTVGAEFHFPLESRERHPKLWKRLALLNMSQHQRGSYIQLSREDRDVIEVRMNPSIYPITIANWQHMRLILPELDQAFFTITINSNAGDFTWRDDYDTAVLNDLRALGMLSYASLFESIPHTKEPEEINFGDIYLGQTVKMYDGEYQYTGAWLGEEGQNGQLGIYAGFGANLPYLAYYLSMGLADPSMLRSAFVPFVLRSRLDHPKPETLEEAFAIRSRDRQDIFKRIQKGIEDDEQLRKTSQAGAHIIEQLRP